MRTFFQILFLCSLPVMSHAEQWQKKANFGGTGRHRAIGLSVGNKGYIGLGHVNGSGIDISYSDWWQFDPASNSWTQKANYPTVNHGAVGFATSTKAYVGGGSYLNGEFYCYDPVLNTWTAITSCPISPGDTPAFSVQNKGYVFSGSDLYEYTPFTNTWAQKTSCPSFVSAWSSAFSVGTSAFVKTLSSLYEYKPSTDTWIQRAYFPGLMSGGGGAFECDDKGYFVCGYSGSLSTVTDEVWEYNPGNNLWKRIGEFPGTSRRFPVAFAINDIGYFGTGTNGVNMNDFWSYNPDLLELSDMNSTAMDVTIYPNPCSDVLNFNIEQSSVINSEDVRYSIFALSGELLIEGDLNGTITQTEISGLAAGTYIYRISNGTGVLKNGQIIKR